MPIASGKTLSERITAIKKQADIELAAIIVIVDRSTRTADSNLTGTPMIEKKYHTKVYSIITEDDIDNYLLKYTIQDSK